MVLPIEIWYIILDTLGEYGELRAHTNLCKALGINPNIGAKYRVNELIKIRNWRCIDYKKLMIQFWEKTGIDDGVPLDYLKANFNKHTRMYRTVWACDTLYNKDTNKHILYGYPAERYIEHNYIVHLTNKIYVDNRNIDEIYDGTYKLDKHSVKRWVDNFKSIMGTEQLKSFENYY